MKQELRNHLIPLGVIFAITMIVWIFHKVSWFDYVYLFFGLAWGAFILDLDHLIYWLYLNPNIEESRLAQIAFHKHDFVSLIKLLESTHKQHVSLVFHHYFSQVVLSLISIFVFTSSISIFTKSFVLALNIHLLVDELSDFRADPKHLQDWLFARESKQLPLRYLKYYLGLFVSLNFIFLLILLTFKS